MKNQGVMTKQQLAQLVLQGEGPNLEFKRSTGSLKDGLRTICAFLNSSGGRILFGVNRNGAIEGQIVSEQTIHEIASMRVAHG